MERMDMCDVIPAHESHGFYFFRVPSVRMVMNIFGCKRMEKTENEKSKICGLSPSWI
jgi:hypothetical protein